MGQRPLQTSPSSHGPSQASTNSAAPLRCTCRYGPATQARLAKPAFPPYPHSQVTTNGNASSGHPVPNISAAQHTLQPSIQQQYTLSSKQNLQPPPLPYTASNVGNAPVSASICSGSNQDGYQPSTSGSMPGSGQQTTTAGDPSNQQITMPPVDNSVIILD